MANYVIDTMHSDVTFKVKHLMISTVTGSFSKFSGTLTAENEDFTDGVIHFEADTDSITTGNEQRDGHLKSAEFFDVAQYPTISFNSTSFRKVDDEEDEYLLEGNLTMHGVAVPVILNVTYGGTQKDFYGQTKIGFDVTGKINRKDFGLTWGGVTETGGIVLADDVKLNFSVQFIKQ